MLDELASIAARRAITCVYAPIWDCEGVAILRDGRFPLVVSLQTTLKFWLTSNQHRLADANSLWPKFIGRADAARSMLELLNESPAQSTRSAVRSPRKSSRIIKCVREIASR